VDFLHDILTQSNIYVVQPFRPNQPHSINENDTTTLGREFFMAFRLMDSNFSFSDASQLGAIVRYIIPFDIPTSEQHANAIVATYKLELTNVRRSLLLLQHHRHFFSSSLRLT
jgi:hypothetical protein